MRDVFIGQSKNGNLSLGTENNAARFRDFLKKNPDVYLEIVPRIKTSREAQRFVEGAIVPYFAAQHKIDGKMMPYESAREEIKLEFNPVYIVDSKGERKKVGGSLADIYANKEKCKKFIDTVERYFDQNGLTFPDPEDFKKWRDSAPAPGEVYPPLKRLLEAKI